jgi:hypothetical protein
MCSDLPAAMISNALSASITKGLSSDLWVHPHLVVTYRLGPQSALSARGKTRFTLITKILKDVGSQEGRLPLLQFALKEMWERREKEENKLTAEAYTAVGGVTGAIEKTAESVYNRLTPAQRDAARRLFLRLVTPGEGQEDTRARSLIPDDPEQRDVINFFSDRNCRRRTSG